MSIELSPFNYDSDDAFWGRFNDRKNSLSIDEDESMHTVVDSFERHMVPRHRQELSRQENLFAELAAYNGEERIEMILLRAVQREFNIGNRPNPDESLFDFIDRMNTESIPNLTK